MGKFEVAGKASLFGAAVSLITGGNTLIRDNFNAGLHA